MEEREYLLRMVCRIYRMDDGLDSSPGIDDEGGTVHGLGSSTHKYFRSEHVKAPRHRMIRIGKERKGELIFGLERSMPLSGILADAKQEVAGLRQGIVMVAKVAGLPGARFRAVLIVEKKDVGLAAQVS